MADREVLLMFALLGIRGTIALALGLALAVALTGLHFERAWRQVAEAKLEAKQEAFAIQKELTELAKEHGRIQAEAAQKRGRVNAQRQAQDFGGLSADFNAPDGVRRKVPPGPGGGPKSPAGYKEAGGAAVKYKAAP